MNFIPSLRLAILFLLFFGLSTSYAQNKKEQIVLLKERVDSFSRAFDSLSLVLANERQSSKNTIGELETSLDEERKTVATLTSKKEALEKNVAELKNSLETKTETLNATTRELETTTNTLKEKEQLLAEKTKEAEDYKTRLYTPAKSGAVTSQTITEENEEEVIPNLDGIYQWTLNEKPIKAKDLIKSKYPEYFAFSLFDGEYSYIVIASSLAEVSKSKIKSLLDKGLAVKYTFDFDGENLTINNDDSGINLIYQKSKKVFVNVNESVNLKLVFKKGI